MLSIAALETILANKKVNADRLTLQLEDDTLSDNDWDLLKSRLIALDKEIMQCRSDLAVAKNAQVVANKVK